MPDQRHERPESLEPPDSAREAREADERLQAQRGKWHTVNALSQWMAKVLEDNHFQDKIFGPIRGR